MLLDYIRQLYAHHYWASERILSMALRSEPAPAAESVDPGYARIHETLAHLVGAEAIWRSRWQEAPRPPRLTPADLPTLLSVQERWRDEQRQIQLFLASLQEDDLAVALTYTDLRGQPMALPLAATLLQVLTHSGQHRAEVALLLTEMGYSPGDLDFLRYLLERAAAS